MNSFQDVIEFLKQDHNKDQESKPEQLKDAISNIRSQLHDKINAAKERFIDLGIQAFEKEDKKFTTDNNLPDANDSKDIKTKVHDLVACLEGMLKRTELIDESIRQVKEESLKNLLVVRKGVLDFKMTKKFSLLVQGKVLCDLDWKQPQNKPSYSTLDTSDKTKLKIHGNSCYNYYQTSQEFSNEDIYAEFITNCHQVSSYFYFGVRNEINDPNNNCMCCAPSSVTYFKSNGNLYVNGSSSTEERLNFTNSSRSEYKVKVRLQPTEKKVYFEVDDRGECGPYTLFGSRWTITFGSCNECNGFIKIGDTYYI